MSFLLVLQSLQPLGLIRRLDHVLRATNLGGHSPGKLGKPGKVREFHSDRGKVRENGESQGKVRETEIYLDFERAEELKLQLLAACGPGL